jgi:hypothetical protein
MVVVVEKNEVQHHYPSHPLTYDNDVWECSETGFKVPKTLEKNLQYRKNVLEWANTTERRESIMAVCAKSPLYWLNVFAWTYRPKYTCGDGRVRGANSEYEDANGVICKTPKADAPIITWPAQDHFVDEIHKCFRQGGTMLADKSREQGATVIIMDMIAWGTLFIDRYSALVISRKSGMVDNASEDSLFGKVDYVFKKLPDWMVSEERDIERRRGNEPLIVNTARQSRIIGETSNKDVGQSLRTTITFVDEAARFPDGRALMKSIDTVSAGYLLASTPSGPGTEFSKLREKAMTPEGLGEITVCTLGYWDHPDMGKDRRIVCDSDGIVTGKAGSYYWESPAFRVARARATSPRDIRENWLIDHDTSGLLVLDSNTLAKLKGSLRPPRTTGTLDVKNRRFHKDVDGKMKVWCELDKYGDPPADDNYVIGADLSHGVDESHTAIAVMSRTTGKIVAEYVDPSIDPIEAARLVSIMGVWFGGQHGHAFVIFERNGPGLPFGHELVRTGYPFVYYQRLEDRRVAKRTRKWGWQSTGDTKEILFATLNKYMRNGWFQTHSEEGWVDMGGWIFDDQGRIVCGRLRDLSTGAQTRHGDIAIAYGVCCLGVTEVSYFDKSAPRFRPGTLGRLAGHDRVNLPTGGTIDPFARKR